MRRSGWGLALVATMVVASATTGARAATSAPVAAPMQAVLAAAESNMSPDLQSLADGGAAAFSTAAAPGLVPATDGPGAPVFRPDGRVLVEIRVDSTDAAFLARLTGIGARIEHVSTEHRVVTAAVQPTDLSRVASLSPGVLWVVSVTRPDSRATCPTGASVSEGDAQLAAALGRSRFGVDGTGITVGVISDSFNRLGQAAGDVSNGELPGASNPCGHTSNVAVQTEGNSIYDGDEGRAMAQIIHDVAPGASIRFATADGGEQSTADQIRALAAAGASVIVDDVAYYTEPMYQDGVIGKAVEDVTAAGVAYFSAAGNGNQRLFGYDLGAYEPSGYRPMACPPAIAAVALDCHDFNDGPNTDNALGISLNTGSGAERFVLGWNEPQNGIRANLDLWLLNSAGQVIAYSNESNRITQRAFEFKAISGTGSLNLVVSRAPSSDPGAFPRFKLLIDGGYATSMEYLSSTVGDVVAPAIFGHNASRSGATVAAVPFNDPTTAEPYSSRGPASFCWEGVSGAVAAAPITPCQASTVDFAATDGVQTSFFGSNATGVFRFYGTSAAAPHAAAVAALIRQKAPCIEPLDVIGVMKSTAKAVGTYGVNAVGGGLVNADAALAAAVCGPPKVGANVVKTIHVLGVAGVPSTGVGAVSLNVTVTQPDQAGYVSVYPCGTPPNASNLNFVRKQTIPNAVIAPVSAGGDVCLVSSAATHLIADVNGWFPVSASGLQALTPSRVLDTRTGVGGVPVAPLAAGGVLTKKVTGANGVPGTGAAAVSLNVTVTEPTAAGYLTVYPCGTPPNASNVNFELNQTVPNAVIAPLDANGQICITSSAGTHVIVDVNGWLPSAGFQALAPSRLFDNRTGLGFVLPGRIGGFVANQMLEFPMLNRNGIPASGVAAVALNVTVTGSTAPGYITVYPCGTLPNASNLNFAIGQTVANQVIAPLSPDGHVCFYSSAPTYLLADVSGWFPTGSTSFQGANPARLLDSRVA